MWMTGLVGMATKYAEALLSVRYREKDARGEMIGGPMYFLSRGVRSRSVGRGLAVAFAVFASVAAFGIGNAVQSQEVGKALNASFGFEPRMTQVVLAVLVAMVTLGGIRWIARFASLLVPTMVFFYLAAGLVVLFLNAAWIPDALVLVFESAFKASALGGGVLGASVAAALRFGISRGVFSNESGLGSAGIAAAAASTREPVRQALVSMTQTFIDTIVVCSVTGLVILTVIVRDVEEVGQVAPIAIESSLQQVRNTLPDIDPFASDFTERLADSIPDGAATAPLLRWKLVQGSEWTTLAFREVVPFGVGGVIVSVGLALFAFSTILGWSYYGEKSVEYLAGTRVIFPYRVFFAAMVVGGPMLFSNNVWLVSDITNGLMAIPNLIGLLLLSGVVVSETRAYFARNRPAV
jgi:AGCS family alanine or glycine:cation symporter